ncbi:MAG: 23S rRNA (adenine(2503)-C(2))-methyltransferase RlmN, partial [Actinomycetota bacterium]|nr:23S rRNA (adenine(2503)-C(2))-methyltransferase RlmN [Actinomycetota bacterium]
MSADPYDLSHAQLAELLGTEPAYRTSQVRAWLARGVEDPAQMTDLPTAVRSRLARVLRPPARLVRRAVAEGGLTHKLLVGSGEDGQTVEAVVMVSASTAGPSRATVCVSTQAGCAMGCPFCATGQAGLRRQLGTGEIVGQVTLAGRLLASGELATPRGGGGRRPERVTHVVFMGMGEPLANPGPTLAAVRWLVARDGLGLSARAITVSTVGLVPGIRRLAALGLPVRLAVSLHAPDDDLRDDLVPINRRYPLAGLLAECGAYRRVSGRRVTFEYVLIAGVNDSPGHARRLGDLLTGGTGGHGGPHVRGLRGSHVNLIPMNPTPGVSWRAPPPARRRAFARVLAQAGVPVTVRRNRGDIDAACGQLAAGHRAAAG